MQPGPKDTPMQCFIKRNKKSSTFYVHLGVADSKFIIAINYFSGLVFLLIVFKGCYFVVVDVGVY